MKQRKVNSHPGPMRVMAVDAEFAGFIVVLGFVALLLAGMPVAKWFLIGAVVFGVGVALLLRYSRKN